MAKKPKLKKRRNTSGILGNKIAGPKRLGINAAAAIAPGAGVGGGGAGK